MTPAFVFLNSEDDACVYTLLCKSMFLKLQSTKNLILSHFYEKLPMDGGAGRVAKKREDEGGHY